MPPKQTKQGTDIDVYICVGYIYLQHPFGDNFPHVGFQLRLDAIEIG